MKNHFRTAVMTVILAGGTVSAYATAFAVMDRAPQTQTQTQSVAAADNGPVRVQVSATAAKRLLSGRSDVSVREACATFEGNGARKRCIQEIAGAPRPIRVIDFASTESATQIR